MKASNTNPQANDFKLKASAALHNKSLQTALKRAEKGFVEKRAKSIAMVDDFDALKERAKSAKQHALSNLEPLLAQFEQQVIAAGGQVHRVSSAATLNQTVLQICQDANAKSVLKGKSMVSEETQLNRALEAAGLDVVETDLGEYIIQLAGEPPSHIIAPAVHKTRQEIEHLFHRFHNLGDRTFDTISALVAEARRVLRARFLSADVGITGANILVAETGSIVLVTNEGNGDLASTLPSTHIVTTSIEKIVATLEDADAILEVLARSATGQALSTYTSFFTGNKRVNDSSGPDSFHVVILDNGRSKLLKSDFEEMLHCIKCGACLNHCPVYANVGGHSYGWVYPGPMGSVLTPLLTGLENATPLPQASTFCGRCEEVCPMSIPLPRYLRQLRNDQHERALEPLLWRVSLRLYAWLCLHPKAFRAVMKLARLTMYLFSGRTQGSLNRVKLPGSRQLVVSVKHPTFLQQWKQQRKNA